MVKAEGFRPDINGLRAIAVLSVFAYHLANLVPGGFLGVDVFFVISGYLISGHIFRGVSENRFSFSDFYVRRARRILPAYFAVSLLTAAAAYFLLLPGELVEFGKSLAASALFIPNIFFYLSSDYFAPAADQMPLLHYWSLGVEEQFYLVLPVVLILMRKLGRVFLSLFVVLAAIASFGACIYVMTIDLVAPFYLLPFRAYELLIGTIIALPFVSRHPPKGILALVIALSGLAAIIASLVFLDSKQPFPGWLTLPVCIGTAAVIWSGGAAASLIHRLLGLAPLQFVGNISYSLYLVHWPAILFAERVFPGADPLMLNAGVFTASLAAATLLYYIVETPFRSVAFFSKPPVAAAYSLVFLGALGAIGWRINDQQGFPSRLDARLTAIADVTKYNRVEPYRMGVCFWDDVPVAQIDVSKCLPPKGAKSVIIWGDSTGAQYYRGLERYLPQMGYQVGQLNASACPSILDYDAPNRLHCRAFNDMVFAEITARRPDYVILAGSWDYGQDPKIQQTIQRLTDAGIRPIVLGQALSFSRAVPDLIVSRIQAGNYSTQSDQDLNEQVVRKDADLKKLMANFPGVKFVSVFDTVCGGKTCPLVGPDGLPLFFDSMHLTTAGSHHIVEMLSRELF